MTVLEFDDLHKAFGPVMAVNGVSLRMEAGGRTAIVGPSGCGKTTLLRLIAGFETPDSGRILLNGKLLADEKGAVPAHLRGIGLVAQDGALFPHLSIADNIGFGIFKTEPRRAARIAELADIVGLPRSTLERWPHEISGGQQQRVALARALARKPSLMLLDEPFSALDAGLRASMRQAVIDLLTDAGIASILVTHDQAEALSYADQVAVMYDGAFIQVGRPQELYWCPRTRRTAEFLGDAIILPARIVGGCAECALNRIPVTAAREDGRARIMIRPEQVRLVRCTGACAHGMTHGTVTAVDFSGAASLVTVRLDPDQPQPAGVNGLTTLHVRQASTDMLNVGDTVTFEITGCAHVLDEAYPAARPDEPRG
ncbi:ABC transporter ATP-binding protein [Pikeienuella sp. HZG-20]|uniref:ABC transporter ATP-binding protein n=1 Tax=Paludibacillus litoralis TaxID=3133267 RepID=UPI0030EF7AC8